MRSTVMLWIGLGLGTCSSVSAESPPILPPPDGEKLLAGLTQAITDSHFQPPIEVTDPMRAPVNFTSPWMVCIRSAQSEETRRITYTAFFKDDYTARNTRPSMMAALRKRTTYSNPHSPQALPKQTRDRNVRIDRGPKPRAPADSRKAAGESAIDRAWASPLLVRDGSGPVSVPAADAIIVLNAQIREMDQARDLVRKARLSARRARQKSRQIATTIYNKSAGTITAYSAALACRRSLRHPAPLKEKASCMGVRRGRQPKSNGLGCGPYPRNHTSKLFFGM